MRRLLALLAACLAVAGLCLVLLPTVRAVPGDATGCVAPRELVGTGSALDRVGVAVVGSLTACDDIGDGTVVYTNHTAVVWTAPHRGPAAGAEASGGTASGALLAGFWQRTGRGALLAPGANVRLPSYGAPYAWSPDARATRAFVAIELLLDGQARAAGAAGVPLPSADDGAFAAAALSCAAAISGSPTGRVEPADVRAALGLARDDIACSNAWMRATLIAADDGWTLPPAADAVGASPVADAATQWFRHSPGFVWRAG